MKYLRSEPSPQTKSKQLGQGMTEYIIIVALIAVAAIGAFSFFGDTARNQVAAMASELGGTSGETATKRATKSGTEAVTLTTTNDVGLSNYTDTATKGGVGSSSGGGN